MPPVTLAAVVDLTKIKMKWKEQYVSEGLNRKVIPAAPKGIYRGLKMIQNITSPRQVEVSSSTDAVHAAVHQSATGFSTTYYDNGGTAIVLNLSSASLDNQETVITLSITYIIGGDTTANWIAYPIADWNALTAAQQAERIVLGTVNVPAPATNITTSMILPNRRTVAWENEAGGNVPWSPIVRNPSFEHGVTAANTVKYSISDWVNRTDLAVNGSFRLGAATVRSGAKSLEFNKSAVGAGVGRMEQNAEIPVVPGQLIHVTGWVRQLIAPTAGSYTFNLYWGDLDSTASGSTSVTASVLATTDAGFRKVDQIFEVPASKYVLKTITIEAAGLTTGSTGVALVVDDFQVHVEAGSPQAISSAANRRLEQRALSEILFEDSTTFSVGQLAALLRFDKSTPASEGRILLERKDQDYSGANVPPAFETLGRLFLGNQLLATEAKSLLPRISAAASVVGGVDYTLMWESVPSGQVGFRKYVSATGSLIETINARWDGTDWNKDVAGSRAQKWQVADGVTTLFARTTGAGVWNDAGWSTTPFVIDNSTGIISANAELTVQANSHVTVSGTGKYKRGSRYRFLTGLHARLVSLFPAVYSNATIDWFAGSSLLFWQQGVGETNRFLFSLEEGEQLNEVRGYTVNGATDVLTMKVHRLTYTVGASLAGTETQLGATQTSANHTGIVEQLTVSGLTDTAAAIKGYSVEFEATAFAGGPICAGVGIITSIP